MKSEDLTSLYPLNTNAQKSKTDVKMTAACKKHASISILRGKGNWCIRNGPVAFSSFQLKIPCENTVLLKKKSDYMTSAVLGPRSK